MVMPDLQKLSWLNTESVILEPCDNCTIIVHDVALCVYDWLCLLGVSLCFTLSRNFEQTHL